MAEVACYRLERTLMGCADLEGGSVHPISVLELANNEVDEQLLLSDVRLQVVVDLVLVLDREERLLIVGPDGCHP